VGLWKKQGSGVRIQELGVRSQNNEHLLSAFCLVLPALCLLPTGYRLLHLKEALWRGPFAGKPALDKMSPPTGKERPSNSKK